MHLSRKWAKLSFSKIRKKSIIPFSPNCDEELYTVFGSILIKYQIQTPSQTVAEEVLYHKNGKNCHFQKFVKKSIIQISQNCAEELCTVLGSILIKYQIQNPSHTVPEDLHLS